MRQPLWTRTLVVLTCLGSLGAGATPPAEPAHIDLQVRPESVASGGEAQVTLRLEPKAGVKLNRYPRIKLSVPAQQQLAAKAEISVGSDRPPDDLAQNYFDKLQPLTLTLRLAESLPPGRHEIAGQLSYNYCVPASGFCAPKRVALKIPVQVR
jgi:hypothetical protein